MIWQRAGAKTLPTPMLTQFADVSMPHPAFIYLQSFFIHVQRVLTYFRRDFTQSEELRVSDKLYHQISPAH